MDYVRNPDRPRMHFSLAGEDLSGLGSALAKLRKAELVTGDPEFKEIEDDVKILWL